jgi:hypothetical protein
MHVFTLIVKTTQASFQSNTEEGYQNEISTTIDCMHHQSRGPSDTPSEEEWPISEQVGARQQQVNEESRLAPNATSHH